MKNLKSFQTGSRTIFAKFVNVEDTNGISNGPGWHKNLKM